MRAKLRDFAAKSWRPNLRIIDFLRRDRARWKSTVIIQIEEENIPSRRKS